MPLLMSLEGPQLSAIDEIRASLYAVPSKNMWKANAQLSGLFDPFTAKPWLVAGGLVLGMWLAGSTKGRALVSKFRKRR
jgi:hypothetical protein